MADKKITALVELAETPNDADLVALVDDVVGTPTTKKITIANLLGGIKDILNYADSPMVVTGGVITEGTNAGTFKVSALTCLLRSTDSEIGDLIYLSLAEQDNQAITAVDTTYYISLNYNGGSPTISLLETNPYNADERRK